MSRTSVLLTGTHRSGSTWVGQMLGLSRELASVHEPFNPANRWGWVTNPPAGPFVYDAVVEAAAPAVLERDLERLVDLSYPTSMLLRRVRTPRNLAAVGRDALQAFRWRRARSALLMKDPTAFFIAPWLNETLGMRPLVLVRHPAAFASSLKRLDWRFDARWLLDQPRLMAGPLAGRSEEVRTIGQTEDPVAQASLVWLLFNSIVVDDYADRPGWLVKRYEDLAADPVGAFRCLYGELGLDFDEAVVERMTPLIHGQSTGERGDHMSVRRSTADTVFAWRDRLSESEIDMVHEITAPLADRLYPEAWSPA